MSSNKRVIQIIAVLAVLFIAGLVFLYFQVKEAGDMWPFFNEPGSHTARIRQLENEISKMRTEVAKIPAAKKQLEDLTVEHELAVRVLPRENNPDQLLAAIRTKAQQSGVIPDRVSPAVSKAARTSRRGAAGQPLVEWVFTLEIRGTYDQIATFINRMEEFESSDANRVGSEKRFFQVKEIAIEAEDRGLASINFAGNPEAIRGHKCTLIMSTFRYSGQQQ